VKHQRRYFENQSMESSVVLDCIYLRCMTQIQFTAMNYCRIGVL